MPGNVRAGGSSESQSQSPQGSPTRAMSLDSLNDKNAPNNLDQKIQEYLPSRMMRTGPKINPTAMKFVKMGPASLYKSATEQIKKAEEVKELRKTMVTEETEWQQNLDKWKNSRRKRLQTTVESIIQIKKNEEEEEMSRTRRKSKTFSQMQEDKTKRGRKYNLTIHDDDDNDLSSLGLTPSKTNGSIADTPDDVDPKDLLDQDNKDAKSDAGFCTGSDTGSDGVFAEDNISDTSSALGDKKEAHDSLLDTGGSKDDELHLNGHGSTLMISEVLTTTSTTTTSLSSASSSTSNSAEYTYDKAIASYKQYAENSAKKRTSSITSLNSNASHKDEEKKDRTHLNGRSPSPNKGSKLEEKVSFFKEMEKESRETPEPRVVMREKSPKININQRRSMFENATDLSSSQIERQQKQMNRRSLDIKSKVASFENLEAEPPTRGRASVPNIETNLRSKVSSFENLCSESTRVRGITPPRDTNFQVKLATFNSTDSENVTVKKRTPDRDLNFHKKLASFNTLEAEETPREQKIVPQRDPSLKKKIASFEQLEQAAETRPLSSREDTVKSKDRSMSLENLDEPQVEVKMRSARSLMNIRRNPSTHYMEVDLEHSRSEECMLEAQPGVNAQVFEIASKLEETPLIGSPVTKAPTLMDTSTGQEEDSLEVSKEYSDADINEVEEDTAESRETVEEHQYQTLEEVRQEAPPPPPARVPTMEPPEVVDVTWMDGPTQAAPPSEPPPPPPPDDDSDSDVSEQQQSLPEEDGFNRENSTRRLKKELWRRRSDFLGTSSQYIEEEQSVRPPPDLSDLLRQEREAERSLMSSRASKTSTEEMLSELEIARREREIIENLERSEQLRQQQQQQQQQQTWVSQRENISIGEPDDLMQYHDVESPLTPSALDMGPTVAKVPLASPTNNSTISSVPESSGVSHVQPLSDSLERLLGHSESTTNTDDWNAEVLHKRTLSGPQPHSSRSESQLVTDCYVATSPSLDDSSTSFISCESQPEYKKLAELEEEMLRHDKDMLRRAGHHIPDSTPPAQSSQPIPYPPADTYATQDNSGITQITDSTYKIQYQQQQQHQLPQQRQQQPPSHLPIQEFYTAPTYEAPPSLEQDSLSPMEDKRVGISSGSSQYSALTAPHPFTRSNSQSAIETNRHAPLQGVRSTPLASPRETLPEPLPRKKKVVSPPVPRKNQRMLPDLNTAERLEAMRVSRMSSNESPMSGTEHTDAHGNTSPSGQQMSKQTLLALSAIPKPRLTENESWIKKKQEGQKRDYSKHWLHQEAEQRRLEQQERISRPKYTPPLPQRRSPQSASPQFPPHQHPSQTSFPPQTTATIPPTSQNATPAYSSYPQALRNPSPSRSSSTVNNTNTNTNNNNNLSSTTSPLTAATTTSNNNNWRNQATTYQPHIPAPSPAPNGDKALPDSIINNLTQRFNNKNNKNAYNNSNSRVGNNNYRDENYHDYMNADALNSPSGPSPLFQGSQPSPPTTQPDANPQDQRLLSVSGKKKCSHCSEELGRGAAMIIESLRLFYHIPCFKCCVCGIQLGNGSAGADVRVRNHKLHCHNCYSNDEGMKFSKV